MTESASLIFGAPPRLRFFVAGEAIPQGSMRVFMLKGRPKLTSDNPNMKEWRLRVGTEAQIARQLERFPYLQKGAVVVSAEFVLPRPASLPRRVTRMTKRPDLDKLARSLLDALTHVLYDDDSQVDSLTIRKRYAAPGEPPGAWIDIEEGR